ncbi:glutathione S-transferase family protein [Sphingobium nicotianae]|uniref:Glutathione S-transferase family protein n=1 Tax=Sphingobium nicotianae TaxID=2782607 RepID=A0A9X1IQB5_9SPHN|nr:glutathione S-transferase family protein [Sphingobium nicotianae]MBT2186612.1 glutathione S-transferase family protein [Sphingobium nicotianae]
MSYTLYAHPFSSYCWKVLIALHEKELPFDYKMIESEEAMRELNGHWPLGKFPVLVDEGVPVIESTTIIEYLDLRHYERAPLVPANAIDALDVRFMDRVFDNHVMTPMNAIVQEYLIDGASPDRARIAKAEAALDAIYAWLDVRLAGRTWASSHGFSLADCAAAPALFYADWVREIPDALGHLRDYRALLNARPSVANCIEEARPYRGYFPPGAPDRD